LRITGDDDPDTPECLESEHRSVNSFDGAMVLPGDVAEVLAFTHQAIDESLTALTLSMDGEHEPRGCVSLSS